MSRNRTTGITILTFALALVFGQGVFADALDERQQRDMQKMTAKAGDSDRCEGTAIVHSEPATGSPDHQALIEELATARKSGDRAREDEITSILSPGNDRTSGALAAKCPQVVFPEAPSGGTASRFTGDVLVVGTSLLEGHPDMVCTSSGDFYVVCESMSSYQLSVYKSTDGGETWSLFMLIFDLYHDIKDPAIAVAEAEEDYVYLAYEYDNSILVMRIDLDAGTTDVSEVANNVLGVGRPRIVTDNHDYSGYYVYITYVSGTLLKGGDAWEVMAARSRDKAVTWQDYNSLYIPDFSDPIPRPDIAYGEGIVYVCWDEEVVGPSTEMDVYVACSGSFGQHYVAKICLTDTTSYDCFDPRVAAIQDSEEAMVAYTKDWVTDNDVYYGYSLDKGLTWSVNHGLGTSTSTDEERPDICVSPALGDFHVVYWEAYDVIHRHAYHGTPTSWSAEEVVNDTNDASRVYYPPTVATHFGTGAAGVAWSDFRDPAYAIYFDRSDWTGDPVPDIKGNGVDLPLLLHHTDDITITISLDPGDMNGIMADWWVWVEKDSANTWWAKYRAGFKPQWTKLGAPIRFAGATLRTVNSYTVIGPRTVPIGYYLWTFAVDMPNGIYEGTYADTFSLTTY